MGRLEASLIFEALATGCVPTTAYFAVHNMCAWMLDQYATEEQKQRWLEPLCKFNTFAAYCLTEPGSSSDSNSIKTTATDNGKGYFTLNGSKAFTTNFGDPDVYLVMCLTGPGEHSCLLVEKDTPGLSLSEPEEEVIY